MTDFRVAVNTGIATLDAHDPEWASKITLDSLDLSYGDKCVLGQVFGSYWLGVQTLSGQESFSPAGKRWAERNGFYVNNEDYERGLECGKDPYGDLLDAWVMALV